PFPLSSISPFLYFPIPLFPHSSMLCGEGPCTARLAAIRAWRSATIPRMSQLLQCKPIAALVQETEGTVSLKRELGAGDLIMLAIGAVIGAGIFSSIGTAAAGQVLPDGTVVRYGAGPALTVSFILLGIVCAFAALCYAELAAMIPQAGSAYAYCYA